MPKQDSKRNRLPQAGDAERLDVNIQQKPAVHTRDANNTKPDLARLLANGSGEVPFAS